MQENITHWQENNPQHKDKIQFNFFKAKTPQDITQNGFINRYNRFLAWVWKAKDLRITEMACFASHLALWEKCVELDKPIFILEDDVDFTAYLWDGAQDIARSKYEYVRFCWINFKKTMLVNDKFAFGTRTILGTGGYYITPQGAKKLIANAKQIYLPVDYYISISYIHGAVEMVYMRPLVKLNALSDNTTIKDRNLQKSKAYKKRYKKFVILRELHRIYWQLRSICFALTHFFRL